MWVQPLNAASVVVDAGTHRGEFSQSVNTLLGCRCILIEANPILAQSLVPPPRGEVVNAALSASEGTAQFIFRDNLEAGSISSQASDRENCCCTVKTITISGIMQQFGIRNIDMLKIDIEGSEFPLLDQTSPVTLKSIGQITVEFHDFIPDYHGKGLFEHTRRRLELLGFICLPMSFRTHGDILFLNQEMLLISAFSAAILKVTCRWIILFRRITLI